MKKVFIAFLLLPVLLCAWSSAFADSAAQENIDLSGTSWTADWSRWLGFDGENYSLD